MKIVYEYSHLGGKQILQVDYPEIFQDVHDSIRSISDIKKNKVSKEKTSKGKMLYSPRELNKAFATQFNSRGFHEIRDKYNITIPNHDKIISNSYKQIDFVKNRVLVEVQFGKYAFMFYDMAKFQYFFNENVSDVGIEIVPCHNLQQQMSTGVSYGEQLVYDIERLKRHFPSAPVYIILVDVKA